MIISVVTAYYKGSKYMKDYAKMIRKNAANLQDGDSIEVIIVNDSPDEEVDIEIKCENVELKVINNPTNLGIHRSRINGLKESCGEYIIFLDQDDLLGKNAIKTYMENVAHRDEVLVCNAALGQKEGYLKWYRSKYHANRIGDIKCYCDVGIQIISPGHTCIYKESIPEEWKEYICTYNGADDYFLWLLMLSRNVEFRYIDKVMYLHKYTGSNLSADTRVTDISTLEFCNHLDEIEYFPYEYVMALRRMIDYKARFRMGSKRDKITVSAKNIGILGRNIIYKIMTRTPLGFNR